MYYIVCICRPTLNKLIIIIIIGVWPRSNHAHTFKDGNMMIYFNTDMVQSTIRDASITLQQSTVDHSTLEARPINSEQLSLCKNTRG